jgi:hypothetical protein
MIHRSAPLMLAMLICHSLIATAAPIPMGESVLTFPSAPPQAAADEVKARLHSIENPPPFTPSNESVVLHLPPSYTPSEPHGLLIWISPTDSPRLPKDWLEVLAKKQIIFAGANRCGNARNIFDRIRMAVTINAEIRKQLHIDGRRVYAAGFSGGGRVASMLGVAWADMFSGSVPFMGVNFYTDLPSADGRKTYAPQYIPDDSVLELAKRTTRHVLVTADQDFNRADTNIVFEKGFRAEGFANVQLLQVPDIGHKMPSAAWFEKALQLLETSPKKP